MEEITIKQDNKTMYYLDDKLLLTITELGNDEFITENSFGRLQGICKKIDEYTTSTTLKQNQIKGKNGRLYNTKKLFAHNRMWFGYILQKNGFVAETLPMY